VRGPECAVAHAGRSEYSKILEQNDNFEK
jgi:hypothetical protein